MSYNKFTVEELRTTPSGKYATYTREDGTKVWTNNRGYQVGDVVEMFDHDGYCPSKIIINGVVTWTEEDKKKWWEKENKRRADYNEKVWESRKN